jgi:hypothetical protein
MFLALYIVDSAGSDFVFGTVAHETASTDTPASVIIRPGLSPTVAPVDWGVINTTGGWLDIGGVVRHSAYRFTIENKEYRGDHTRPLDDLLSLDFEGEEAIWYACPADVSGAEPTYPDLADCTIIGRGTIDDASFGKDVFTVTVTDQAQAGLDLDITPTQYRGLSRGVKVETAGGPSSGPRIVRPDHSALRSQADQYFACGLSRGTGDAGSAEYTVVDSPIFRVRRDASGDTLKAELKNLAGSWQTVGTPPTWTASAFFGILVSYVLSTTTATLWVNGVSAGTTVITGGIFSASTATTRFYNAPTVGTMEITHWFFRHGSEALTDTTKIEDRSMYSFDIDADASVNCALEFVAGVGDSVSDWTGNASALLSGFADTDGAWVASDTGEPSMARTRPRAVVGRPFGALLDILDLSFQDYSPGYEGSGVSGRVVRFVAQNSGRLEAPVSVTKLTDFVAANRQCDITGGLGLIEPSVGQSLNFAAGPNAGALVVSEMLLDPLQGAQPLQTVRMVLETTVVDDTSSGAWTGTGKYATTAGETFFDGWSKFRLSILPAGDLTASFNTNGGDDDANRLVGQALEHLAAETAATLENVKAISVEDVGYQVAGDTPALQVIDALAKDTLSDDGDLPCCVFRTPATGAWTARGAQEAPASAAWTWVDDDIISAEPAPDFTVFKSVKVRYGRYYSFQGNEGSRMPTYAQRDRFSAAVAKEWREVRAGTGAPTLILDSAYLSADDAQARADAVLNLLQSGIPYTVNLKGPRSEAELAAEPFDICDVTWTPNSFLAARKGNLVGLKVQGPAGAWAAVAVVVFIS